MASLTTNLGDGGENDRSSALCCAINYGVYNNHIKQGDLASDKNTSNFLQPGLRQDVDDFRHQPWCWRGYWPMVRHAAAASGTMRDQARSVALPQC